MTASTLRNGLALCPAFQSGQCRSSSCSLESAELFIVCGAHIVGSGGSEPVPLLPLKRAVKQRAMPKKRRAEESARESEAIYDGWVQESAAELALVVRISVKDQLARPTLVCLRLRTSTRSPASR